MSDNLHAFIDGLPVAELHMHIEGSFEPELMFKIAQRNGLHVMDKRNKANPVPFNSAEEIKAAYEFNNLQEFLDIYYAGMDVLQTDEDFYDLTMAYMERAAADNVMHTEIFFDPQGHTTRNVPFRTVLGGITAALDDAQRLYGVSSHVIMCFLRHLDEKSALKTLRQALPYKDKIIGVGLDSGEKGNPPIKFARVFAKAAEEGYKKVMHVCEEGPPSYAKQALRIGVDRFDHGNRSLEDAALTQRLVAMRMPLTVCPLSNLKLCGVRDLREHPIKRMLGLGLMATVNSDDPSYFGGYVKDNFKAVADAVGLTREEIATLALNSINASFAGEQRKKEMRADLESYLAHTPRPLA